MNHFKWKVILETNIFQGLRLVFQRFRTFIYAPHQLFWRKKNTPKTSLTSRRCLPHLEARHTAEARPKGEQLGAIVCLTGHENLHHPQQKWTNSSPEKEPCSKGNCIFPKKSMYRKWSAIQIATERFRSGVFFLVFQSSKSFHHYRREVSKRPAFWFETPTPLPWMSMAVLKITSLTCT